MTSVIPAICQRLFPASQHESLMQSLQALLSDTEQGFIEIYRDPSFKPMIHAEIAMVDHFYRNQLDFHGSERYIGCSKPSCFCCEITLRHHPLRPSLRPAHGNLWIKWSLPAVHVGLDILPSLSGDELQRLIEEIKQNIIFRVIGGARERARTFDSFTNLTPTSGIP